MRYLILTVLLLTYSKTFATTNIENLVDLIIAKNWSMATSALTQVSSEELLKDVKQPDGSNSGLIWLAMNPEDAIQDGLSPELTNFSNEQRDFVKKLVEKSPKLLSIESAPQGLPVLFISLYYYDLMWSTYGESEAREYLEKIKFLIEMGANPLQKIAIPNMKSSLPVILAQIHSPRALDYLYRSGLVNLFELFHTEIIGQEDPFEGNYSPMQIMLSKLPETYTDEQKTLELSFIRTWVRENSKQLGTHSNYFPGQHAVLDVLVEYHRRQNDASAQTVAMRAWQEKVIQILLASETDINKKYAVSEDTRSLSQKSIVDLVLEMREFALFDWILDNKIQRSRLSPSQRALELATAFNKRDYARINLILKVYPVKDPLNQVFISDSLIYSPLPFNMAVGSLLNDGNLNATIDLIQQLVERGADITKRSRGGLTVKEEPRWLKHNIVGGNFNLETSRFSPDEMVQRLDLLDEYLHSSQFTQFAKENFGKKIGRPFELTCGGAILN